jgi:hypothetical protein
MYGCDVLFYCEGRRQIAPENGNKGMWLKHERIA